MSDTSGLTWNGRFADPAAEAAFLVAHLPDARTLGRLIVLSILALDAVFIPIDAVNFGPNRDGVLAVGLRLAILVWSAVCWRMLARADTPAAADRLLGFWAAATAAVNLFVLWAVPGDHQGAAPAFAVGVVLCYLLPVRLECRAGVGGAVTVGFLVLLAAGLRAESPRHTLTDTAIGFVLANGAGGLIGRWLAVARRRQFAATSALEKAATELRTLRGLLPICACCKNIRDDAGGWHRMEAYIQARTDAKFTHGVCPSCLASEYGVTLDDANKVTIQPS